jgi:hypothetical protein
MIGLVALLSAAQAADVLFVEATPATLDDFSVAGLFYGMVVSAAEGAGVDFEDADAIRAWAGRDADACWDVDVCPANLWDRTGARLIVVMSVGRVEGGLEVGVRLHGADERAPFKVIREVVPPGKETAVAAKIARAAADALPLLPEREAPAPPLVFEDEVIPAPDPLRTPDVVDPPPRPDTSPKDPTGPPASGGTPEPPIRGGDPRPDPDPPTRAGLPPTVEEREERRRMGIPAGAYARYRASGLTREEWLTRARVRTGRGFLDVAGGWGIGDVDRWYSVRLRVEEQGDAFTTVGTSSLIGRSTGQAPTFGFTLGYAPTWFLDTSVTLSLQYGAKHMDTGWEWLERSEPQQEELTYEPAGALQGLIEPRVRLYPVATGVVKPYMFVGLGVLVFDGFQVVDSEFIDYPDAAGGATVGPTGGLGLAVDAVSWVSLFAEVPAMYLPPSEQGVTDGEVGLSPSTRSESGYIVRFVGGISVRL